jgi:hypothetical protein
LLAGKTLSHLVVEMEYPLCWPDARVRTLAIDRKRALWKHMGKPMVLPAARGRLRAQIEAMTRVRETYRTNDVVLTTNLRFTASGARDRNVTRDPEDCGAALYFALDRKPLVLACDRWDTVQDNIAAIAAHIEALRGQERWGVADLAQAFAGHVALPAPEQWWQVLGVSANATVAELDAAWRALIRDAHPDKTGSNAAARLNAARDEGRRLAG